MNTDLAKALFNLLIGKSEEWEALLPVLYSISLEKIDIPAIPDAMEASVHAFIKKALGQGTTLGYDWLMNMLREQSGILGAQGQPFVKL